MPYLYSITGLLIAVIIYKLYKYVYSRLYITQDYYRTPHWRQARARRLKIDGYKCQLCINAKEQKTGLHVHHRKKKPYREKPKTDLITLCDKHHRLVHKHELK